MRVIISDEFLKIKLEQFSNTLATPFNSELINNIAHQMSDKDKYTLIRIGLYSTINRELALFFAEFLFYLAQANPKNKKTLDMMSTELKSFTTTDLGSESRKECLKKLTSLTLFLRTPEVAPSNSQDEDAPAAKRAKMTLHSGHAD